MPANLVTGDDVNGIFNQVMEHQEANIVDIWTKAEGKINPILACFEAKSEDDGGGRGFITRVGISTGTSANPSYTLAAAKAAGSTTGNSAITGRWVSQSTSLEIVAAWTRKAMNAARGDGPGEVYDVIARERESKIVLARHRLAVFAVERGYGRVATIVSISDGNLYFTVKPSEVNRFRKGDDICFSQYETTGALDKTVTGDGKWTVAGTDPASGRVTVEANSTYQPYDDGARNGWQVFWFGYREDDATPDVLCTKGLRAWVPEAVPTATSFEGQDTRYNWELNGHRVDATSLDHAGAFLDMASRAQQYGSEIHAIYCSPEDFKILCRNKDAIKTLSQYSAGKYMIGFNGVEVLGGVGGSIPVIPDAYIPQGIAWGGPWNDADFGPKLKHSRSLINVDDLDGNDFLRLATSTGFEQRMYFDGAMIIPAPGKYVIATNLPTS